MRLSRTVFGDQHALSLRHICYVVKRQRQQHQGELTQESQHRAFRLITSTRRKNCQLWCIVSVRQ